MLAKTGFVGARGTDSVQLVDAASAARLKEAGFDFAIQYLGTVTRDGVAAIVAAGLGFMSVTYADKFDGAATVNALASLGLPPGITAWLDVEGLATMDPVLVKSRINAWAESVQNAGFMPGIYVGAGCPLTSVELYALGVTRYWKALSRIIDRNGQLAEPGCGWSMLQLFPSVTRGQVWVDVNVMQQDYRGRLPVWAAA
jgi:hypothetical protein